MATETLTTTTTAVTKAGERVVFPYPNGQPAGSYQSTGAVLKANGTALTVGFGVSFERAGVVVTPAASCEIPAGILTLAVAQGASEPVDVVTVGSVTKGAGEWIGAASRRTLIIAGRGWLAESLAGGASDSNFTNTDSRIPARNGPYESSNIRLVFGNFYASTTADVDGANAITVRAAIELQSSTGTYLSVPVTFNGSLSASIDPKASLVISDPVGVTLPANQIFAVRCNAQVASGEQFPVGNVNHGSTINTDLGDAVAMSGNFIKNTAATVVYSSGFLAGTTAAAGFSHLAVLGETTSAMPSILLFGDSIAKASGDNVASGMSGGAGGGFVGRGLVRTDGRIIPHANFARNGAGVASWAGEYGGADVHRRLALLDYATWAFCEFGTNDMVAQPTLAAMQAYYLKAWGHAKKRGLKVVQSLIMPRVTGTYATAGGQSYVNAAFAPGGLRDQVNAWIRSQVGGGLLDVVIDPNPYVEDSANPGKWRTDQGAMTADGVHPNQLGHTEAAKAVRAWADTLV